MTQITTILERYPTAIQQEGTYVIITVHGPLCVEDAALLYRNNWRLLFSTHNYEYWCKENAI